MSVSDVHKGSAGITECIIKCSLHWYPPVWKGPTIMCFVCIMTHYFDFVLTACFWLGLFLPTLYAKCNSILPNFFEGKGSFSFIIKQLLMLGVCST